ncbi:Ni/Fe hydrogenase [Paramagnetospirillum kuznetsovii]|uniref:Ni/Fe hydrogenase n=1 Tax=Paramagnetospirillum kuznetsovii TaxID=2053833 RepID=A0A364NUS7_9PROT|nr:hydrogenase maturation protease [Paramagnetospirillum kuznetsovii]RAU20839.1 Ni/Fe hydrogenase [Paramagnetospirillum kuznetsovii]
MTVPTLIFGWGNPSRGDDALGPALLDRIEAALAHHPEWGEVEVLTDFQLQVEHALDLDGRERVLFVDASARSEESPFRVSLLEPARDSSFTTHALSPQGVMHVYEDLKARPAPPCHLLAIAGESFELGTPLSPSARANLEAALAWTQDWLSRGAHGGPAQMAGMAGAST